MVESKNDNNILNLREICLGDGGKWYCLEGFKSVRVGVLGGSVVQIKGHIT